MINTKQLSILKHAFPQFNDDETLLNLIQKHGQFVNIPENTIICHDGQIHADLPLLISGLIRVYKISESGKEITLYHIGEKESCVLSASTILSNKKFPAIAETISETQAIVLPEAFVKKWITKSTQWQQCIFGLVAQRLSDVITVVEEVAFQRMDRRIAKFLINQYKKNGVSINITHQDIADEVGTAREVVTRILRDLELRTILKLSRGNIKIEKLELLEALT